MCEMSDHLSNWKHFLTHFRIFLIRWNIGQHNSAQHAYMGQNFRCRGAKSSICFYVSVICLNERREICFLWHAHYNESNATDMPVIIYTCKSNAKHSKKLVRQQKHVWRWQKKKKRYFSSLPLYPLLNVITSNSLL